MSYVPKTSRKWGQIYLAIREQAATGRSFSALDLPYSRSAAIKNLSALAAKGELELVSPAGRGCRASAAQYRATTRLRPAALTGKHI